MEIGAEVTEEVIEVTLAKCTLSITRGRGGKTQGYVGFMSIMSGSKPK